MSFDSVEKLGLIADSHDNMDLLEEAVNFFNEEKVDLVLHAGDFISPLTADPLAGLKPELVGVFGNNDGDRLFLRRRFREEGVGRIERGPYQLEIGEKTVLLTHQPAVLEALRGSSLPDLIVYGHTHEVDIIEGKPMVVNPGEAGGWLTGRATVAVVDMVKMEPELKELSV